MAGRGVQPACIVPVSRAFRNTGYDRAGSGQTLLVRAALPAADHRPAGQFREPPMLGTQSAPGLPPPAVPETARPDSGRHPAAGFLARRLATGIVTLLVASALIFLATNILPGNAAQVVLGRNATGP